MFEPGTKVVCIDGRFPASVTKYLAELPQQGSTYTVRDIIPAQGWSGDETCAVLLVEIVNPPTAHRPEWGECGFAPSRFRELDEDTEVEYHLTGATLSL